MTRLVIFAYGKLEDGILPEIEVLANMLSYFGPSPHNFLSISKTPDGVPSSQTLIRALTRIPRENRSSYGAISRVSDLATKNSRHTS